jgi:hypothetical protein
MDVFTAYLAT